MTFIEKATAYIFSIVMEDETVKNFPKEFVAESAKWIRSWFLKDDPKTEAKLADPNRAAESKKTIIESKVEDLQENEQFVKELTEKLKDFEQQRAKRKGVVENSNIDVQGNFRVGDTGDSSGDNYDEKNIIKGSTIKVGKDFRLGDDVFTGNQNVHIVHNHFNNPAGQNTAPPQYASLKSTIEALIADGKTEKAIETFLDVKDLEDDTHTSLLLQSGRINQLNRQVNNGVLTNEEAKIERARINSAILALSKGLR